jgi:hypothetical protein
VSDRTASARGPTACRDRRQPVLDPGDTRGRAGVALDVLRTEHRWLGQGVWRTFTVEIAAVGIEPADVRIRVAGKIPDP